MDALWVAKGPIILQAENNDSDQTVWMHRLISIFTVGTYQRVPYAGHRPLLVCIYSKNMCKTVTFKKTKIGFQDQLLLSECKKVCRMVQGENSTIFST